MKMQIKKGYFRLYEEKFKKFDSLQMHDHSNSKVKKKDSK